MCNRPISGRLPAWWLGGAVVLAAAWTAGSASAQTGPADPSTSANSAAPIPTTAPVKSDDASGNGIVPASCSSCGGMPPSGDFGMGGCSGCGGNACGGCCIPGRKLCCCDCFSNETIFGRAANGFLECLCCPDPCYEGHWVAVADSAFFVDAARPVTETRFRYDDAYQFRTSDRADYFWGKEGTRGPKPPINHVDYQDLNVYTEAGNERLSAFIEMPYRELDIYPTAPAIPYEHAGFGDLTVGTKSLLMDCELMQMAFEFKTFILTGNFTEGLGTGHVSLEPSLLFNIKLNNTTYVQWQTSFWIPIGGDSGYQSTIWHNHASLNHALWCPCQTIQFVGTLEANEWTIFNGEFTVPDTTVANSSETTIFSAGPGIRMFICDKVDLGVGSAFSITGPRFEKELIRAEFRLRF